jgi:hypothetical protein
MPTWYGESFALRKPLRNLTHATRTCPALRYQVRSIEVGDVQSDDGKQHIEREDLDTVKDSHTWYAKRRSFVGRASHPQPAMGNCRAAKHPEDTELNLV